VSAASFTVLLQGDLAQFDESAVVTRLISQLTGVDEASQISLNLTSASVRVAATIRCASWAAAEAAAGDARVLLASSNQVARSLVCPSCWWSSNPLWPI